MTDVRDDRHVRCGVLGGVSESVAENKFLRGHFTSGVRRANKRFGFLNENGKAK